MKVCTHKNTNTADFPGMYMRETHINVKSFRASSEACLWIMTSSAIVEHRCTWKMVTNRRPLLCLMKSTAIWLNGDDEDEYNRHMTRCAYSQNTLGFHSSSVCFKETINPSIHAKKAGINDILPHIAYWQYFHLSTWQNTILAPVMHSQFKANTQVLPWV